MIDKRQQSIKERLRRFAMDLWNITDLRQMDPVIDLILDVIAYNSSRLHQNISDSDLLLSGNPFPHIKVKG